jgi:hypothetical protein
MFVSLINSFLKALKKEFDYFDNERLYDLQFKIGAFDTTEKSTHKIFNSLTLSVQSIESLQENSDNFGFLLLNMYTFSTINRYKIKEIIAKLVDFSFIDLFDLSLEQTKKSALKNKDMIAHGWTSRDIYMLNFQTYQAISGEVEARFSQVTDSIDEELIDYFELYSSETIDPKKLTVIDEEFLSDKPTNIAAAIEYRGGQYIYHLPDEYSNTINILHETGHLMYDILWEEVVVNESNIFLDRFQQFDYQNVQEYFCDSFVDYIHTKNLDKGLTDDLSDNRKIKNYTDFDKYFEAILFQNPLPADDSLIKNRLSFVNELLKLI